MIAMLRISTAGIVGVLGAQALALALGRGANERLLAMTIALVALLGQHIAMYVVATTGGADAKSD
jgi:hypothetical protein